MNATNKRVATLLRLAEAAPAKTIVQTVNGLLAILRKRGIAIVDFENQSREVHGFKIFTNTAYLLAAIPKPKEDTEHGDSKPDREPPPFEAVPLTIFQSKGEASSPPQAAGGIKG